MDDSIDWGALLYPGEWGFLFFVGALAAGGIAPYRPRSPGASIRNYFRSYC